jgi:hypothetical protein
VAATATVITCRKNTRKTKPPLAPSDLRMAMSLRLRSRKAVIAWPAPTPPTPSATSPTRVRNMVSCSTKRRMPGAASVRSRIFQPELGNSRLAASLNSAIAARA